MIMVDDIIDEGNAFVNGAALMRRSGANRIYVVATHGLFSGDALKELQASEADEIIVTNSIPHDYAAVGATKVGPYKCCACRGIVRLSHYRLDLAGVIMVVCSPSLGEDDRHFAPPCRVDPASPQR